jgi:hypothetical protein
VLPGPAQEVLAGGADRVQAAGGGELVGAGLRGAGEVRGERDRVPAGVGAETVDLGKELPAQRREPRRVRPLRALAEV